MYTKQQLKTRINRLNILADYLQNVVNKKKFNLEYWTDYDGDFKPDSELVKELSNHTCGTTACAFGYAASIPKLRKAGLKYGDYYGNTIISYGELSGYSAAREFFNISREDSEYLFHPYKYQDGRKSKSYVVRRLRVIIREAEKELLKLQK